MNVLPRTLLEAVEAFDADPLCEEVFGEELKASYVELKGTRVVGLPQHRVRLGVRPLPRVLLGAGR